MDKRYGFRVTSERPYPITTTGSLAATGWKMAAKAAVEAHVEDLKAKGRNRKQSENMVIKLWVEGSAESSDTPGPAADGAASPPESAGG